MNTENKVVITSLVKTLTTSATHYFNLMDRNTVKLILTNQELRTLSQRERLSPKLLTTYVAGLNDAGIMARLDNYGNILIDLHRNELRMSFSDLTRLVPQLTTRGE